MASEPPDGELRRLLSFTADDLKANQEGRLSLMQRGRLLLYLSRVNMLFVLFAVLSPVWTVAALLGLVPVVQALGGVLGGDGRGQLVEHVAGIQADVHLHDGDTGFGIAGENSSLDGGGTAPAW